MSGLSITGSYIVLKHGGKDIEPSPPEEMTMSNSSRIEAATRQHVGQTLTAAQVEALVKLANPNDLKGVYPGDAAGKRLEDGTITYRGKQPYGDLVLLQVASGQYRVLPTEEIVRMPRSARGTSTKGEVVIPPPSATVEEPAIAPKQTQKKQKAA
jgi:hypothetical protein